MLINRYHCFTQCSPCLSVVRHGLPWFLHFYQCNSETSLQGRCTLLQNHVDGYIFMKYLYINPDNHQILTSKSHEITTNSRYFSVNTVDGCEILHQLTTAIYSIIIYRLSTCSFWWCRISSVASMSSTQDGGRRPVEGRKPSHKRGGSDGGSLCFNRRIKQGRLVQHFWMVLPSDVCWFWKTPLYNYIVRYIYHKTRVSPLISQLSYPGGPILCFGFLIWFVKQQVF